MVNISRMDYKLASESEWVVYSAAAMLGPSSAMLPASEDVGGGGNCGALAVLVSMLTSSALTLDLVVHQHTLTAASLLFAGQWGLLGYMGGGLLIVKIMGADSIDMDID